MKTYLDEIDEMIQNKHLLSHSFYKAWSAGKLTKECLKDYAVNYYAHVLLFPTYLSAVHCNTANKHTRKHLLQNLIEEEAGSPNHPELWNEFACSLGATPDEIDANTPVASIQTLISNFKDICDNHGTASGIASLYAYESQIPTICESKIDGLRKYYGMTAPKNYHYFTIHIEADKEHAAVERKLLEEYVTAENVSEVKASVQRTLDSLWGFLDEMCERHNIPCDCQTAA